ncbi:MULTISPECIES: ABC transporter ATP-binding protein [Aminobacterium]|jgi:iron(III) transport system ATP-binding protein|uniref:ABC transporter ATP-binding protein n=1 Tax=Aminobacterium TaxID=81466 RepID=UPI000466F288|nr:MULTISPECIES: ABC transporter ATP-binding protein [Aminobacterium]
MELRIENLVKEFGSYDDPASRFLAVNHVSLHVKEGELVTLLGPSGCGKTTLLRMIAGFEDPTEGDIFFGTKRVNDVAPNHRNATMVFQSYAIFPHLNVYENIAFGLRLKGQSDQEVEKRMRQVLDLVGLAELERRQPNQLSGGQQQRVALARAIIMEPQLLLFDEPLSNLDAKLREQMRIEIRSLQKRLGITSVYVTHDQAEAMSISDRVVVMNQGKIEQVGTPQDLYAKPANIFVAAFIGKVNFIPATVLDENTVQIGNSAVHIKSVPPQSRQGEKVLATVRPEGIFLRRDTAGDGNGVVVRRTFLGTIIEYEIKTNSMKDSMIVHMVNPLTNDFFQVGESVAYLFKEGALHLLRSE